jgi:phosphatidylserine decarboxylase
LRLDKHVVGKNLGLLAFLLSNRIPRLWLGAAFATVSQWRQPWFTALGIWLWRRVGGLDLSDAKTQRFASLHECFTRELRPGARVFAPGASVFCSPSDGVVGAHGPITGDWLEQFKDSTYSLAELLQNQEAAAALHGGFYLTLRLTPNMYHRFHAPTAITVERLRYISGDAFNVAWSTLSRLPRVFCRNERAVLCCTTSAHEAPCYLVPIAAVLVASMRFTFTDLHFHPRYRGVEQIEVNQTFERGQTLGWFEHGSTIVILVPKGYALSRSIHLGSNVRAGEALFERLQ